MFCGVVALLSAAAARADDYGRHDDVQVPAGRHYRGLVNAGADDAHLWEGGRVNFFIDVVGTNPANPSPGGPLQPKMVADVRDAIGHWEAMTCIRFTECTAEASCAKPYIRFQSDASACNSPVGVAASQVNEVNLAGCSFGAIVHEIGHSLGLAHEQSRTDRDDFVYVDMSQVKPGKEENFKKSDPTARAIGPYDYDSIMQYGAFTFAKGAEPVIVAPYKMGQREGLSDGDRAGIAFMYHNCKALTRPLCATSKATTVVHTIPHSVPFRIEVNWIFDEDVTVSYSGTTAPTGQVTYSQAAGTAPLDGHTVVEFVPDKTLSGQAFALEVAVSGRGETATCGVSVAIATADSVCFGKSGDDPAVCSGRGTCVNNDPLQPCHCDALYGGLDCSAFADCPVNVLKDFEEGLGVWSAGSGSPSALDHFSAKGGSSWMLGEVGVAGTGRMELPKADKPGKMSFYLAVMGGGSVNLRFSDTAGNECVGIGMMQISGAGRWMADKQPHFGFPSYREQRFYRIDIVFHWDAGTATYYVDGAKLVDGALGCTAGITEGYISGNLWFDDFRIMCSNYVLMTGSVTDHTVLQADLRAGGETLTLTLVGDFDEWVDTEENKQAILDCMNGDYGSGWNERRGAILDTSLVAIDAGDKQILRIGPFKADADYFYSAGKTVHFDFESSMVKSGKPPINIASFAIEGMCPQTETYPFDDGDAVPHSLLSIDTTTMASGTGSLKLDASVSTTKLLSWTPVAGGTMPDHLDFSLRTESVNSWFKWKLGVLTLEAATGGTIKVDGQDTGLAPKAQTWQRFVFTFDWGAGTASLAVDGVSSSQFPIVKEKIERTYVAHKQAETVWIDDVQFVCVELVKPKWTLVPPTPAPATALPTTIAPDTASPDTTSPATIAPGTTNAPDTASPDTTSPATIAPGTTNAPDTASPDTTSPATIAPGTTNAPDTASPDTTSPATIAPGTTNAPDTATTLPTAVPGTTPAPVTPAPATPVPATQAVTPAPPTTEPVTPEAVSAEPTSVPAAAALCFTRVGDCRMDDVGEEGFRMSDACLAKMNSSMAEELSRNGDSAPAFVIEETCARTAVCSSTGCLVTVVFGKLGGVAAKGMLDGCSTDPGACVKLREAGLIAASAPEDDDASPWWSWWWLWGLIGIVVIICVAAVVMIMCCARSRSARVDVTDILELSPDEDINAIGMLDFTANLDISVPAVKITPEPPAQISAAAIPVGASSLPQGTLAQGVLAPGGHASPAAGARQRLRTAASTDAPPRPRSASSLGRTLQSHDSSLSALGIAKSPGHGRGADCQGSGVLSESRSFMPTKATLVM